MTGIAGRGHSLRLVRTCIELTVLATGWLLGGTVGIGTVLYAVGIGPLVHLLLPRLTIRAATQPTARPAPEHRHHMAPAAELSESVTIPQRPSSSLP